MVGAAIGEFLFQSEGNRLESNPAKLWNVVSPFVETLNTTVTPKETDVSHILNRAKVDAHVHFGQMVPSSVVWLFLMQGHYSPDGRRGVEVASASVSNTCGPAWILAGHAEWRNRRQALISRMDDSEKLWSKQVKNSKFPGEDGPLAATWEDAQSPAKYFLLQYLFAERMLIACGYYLARCSDSVAEVFWPYVSARVQFAWNQVPHTSGFEAFQRTEDLDLRKGYLWGATGDTTIWCQLVVAWLESTGINVLDVRHNIRASDGAAGTSRSLNAIQAQVDALASARHTLLGSKAKTDPLTYNVVLSINRTTGSPWDVSYGRRQPNWRILRQGIDELADAWLQRDGGFASDETSTIKWKTSAVDLISNEFGFDAGIAAPAFDRFRRQSRIYNSKLQDRPHRPNEAGLTQNLAPPLSRYYHSGEDWEHPVTALRVLWEAIDWFDFGVSDRLGHASVLFREPEDYVMNESFGERLDNLSCLWWLLKSSDGVDAETTRYVRNELEECHRNVHELAGLNASHSDLCDAWLLRALPEDYVESSTLKRPNVVKTYLGYTGISELDGRWKDLAGEEAKRIQDVYARRAERVRGKYPQALWDSLRQAVVVEIKRRGISIETCPSSNLIVSGGWAAELPTIGLVDLGLASQVVIGTDDPKMLKTDINVEVALIAEALSRRTSRCIAIQDYLPRMIQRTV